MMKLNIAICDDNKLVLENEKALIEETLKEMGIPYKMDKYQNPENLIKNAWQYDLVFLDVEMDEVNGIVAAESIHNINKECLLFFVTNHEVYMDYAMNEYAFRFWVKPMSKEKLKFGLESALKRLESNNKCIEFNTDRNVVNIPINKIIFICAENKKTTIVTVDEQFVVDRPYKVVKDMINSYFFYESHASYYVNLNYVKAYSPSHVKCGIGNHEYEIHMSRRKYTEFNKYFIKNVGAHFIFPMHCWEQYDIIEKYKKDVDRKFLTGQIMNITAPGQQFVLD